VLELPPAHAEHVRARADPDHASVRDDRQVLDLLLEHQPERGEQVVAGLAGSIRPLLSGLDEQALQAARSTA
jgi:hypothetical protein